MPLRKLEISLPTPKEAAQLSTILWATVASVLAPALIFFSGQVQGLGELIAVLWGTLAALALTAPCYLVLRAVAGRPSWIVVPASILSVIAVAILQAAADYGGQFVLHEMFDMRLPSTSRSAVLLVTFIYSLIDSCAIALFLVVGAMRRVRLRESELAAAEVARLRTELTMLRLQLNPHFLCNSLNVVSGLIVTGRVSEANQMTEGLADFLQASMQIDTPSVPLREEIETVERYLEIEGARFGERLQVAIVVSEGIDTIPVPSFLLQPLVENAVKHGVEAVTGDSLIEISARRDGDALVLAVENGCDSDGAAPSFRRPSHGIGLANIRARLDMLYAGAASLDGGMTDKGYCATIRLPIDAETALRSAA